MISPDSLKNFKQARVSIKKIQRYILNQSALPKKKTEEHLIKMLSKYGNILKIEGEKNFLEAFNLANEWNNYELQNADIKKLTSWINRDLVEVTTGELMINKETWGWLVCLAYLKATATESPNHFFLKYLLELYFRKNSESWEIDKEFSSRIFTERIRYDLCLQREGKIIIGEVGGVQTWKVMAALEQCCDVVVIPHWTTDKKHPFCSFKSSYDFFLFQSLMKGGGSSE